MHILVGDYCASAHEAARQFYANRVHATSGSARYSCFGATPAALGRIRGIRNTRDGTPAPSASDPFERAILAQHAAWFEHLRSAAAAGPYDIVELPSYYPFGHLVKDMLGARLRLVLHGMNSQMLAASYENHASLFDYVRAWRKLENSAVTAADEIVATSVRERISLKEQFGYAGDAAVINPFLFLPRIPASSLVQTTQVSAGRGTALHIVYVGPIDGIHQPHRLTELAPRVRGCEVRFKAYGSNLRFHSIDTSDIVRSISPHIEFMETRVNWWESEDPENTIVAYLGHAMHWAPLCAAARGYTICLSDSAGCKQLFDDCGLTYCRLEDETDLRPLPRRMRIDNVERMLAAAKREAYPVASFNVGEPIWA